MPSLSTALQKYTGIEEISLSLLFLNYPSAMPSLLTSPLLNHGQFRNVLANAFSLIAF